MLDAPDFLAEYATGLDNCAQNFQSLSLNRWGFFVQALQPTTHLPISN